MKPLLFVLLIVYANTSVYIFYYLVLGLEFGLGLASFGLGLGLAPSGLGLGLAPSGLGLASSGLGPT